MWYSFAYDPGINCCAWALVSEDKTDIKVGLIRQNLPKTDSWVKTARMIQEADDFFDSGVIRQVFDTDIRLWTVEGQYTAYGKGDPGHQVRNGWIASAMYSRAPEGAKKIIALPSTWTRGKPKEIRNQELLTKIKDHESWDWYSKIPPKDLLHNVYDAVAMAVWSLENHKS